MSELMKKNQRVLTLEYKEGVPVKILKIHDKELLPLSLQQDCTIKSYNEWFEKRKLPKKRDGFSEMVKQFGNSWLKSKNYASLTDQYWIRNMDETWKKVNFFTNQYSYDVGDIAFKPWMAEKKRYDTNSPDLTTNGRLKKRWIQRKDYVSCLIKAGNRALHQEPLSEVLVSVLLEQLRIIPFVRYDLYIEGIELCSRCKNFITAETEFVPMSDLYYSVPKLSGVSVYEHLLNVMKKYKIPGGREYVNKIIFIDRLTGNDDRHLGNMGVIKNVETNEYVCTAPLFDSGNAYWDVKAIYGNIPKNSTIFSDVDKEIFEEVKCRVDLEKILDNENFEMFEKTIWEYPQMSNERKDKLIKAIKKRNEKLCMTTHR